ncbi:MAG: phage protein Gp36 family protein [candidate division WOR-3 bacterium]
MITINDVEKRISIRKLIELTQDDVNANNYDIVKVNEAIEKSISLVKAYLKNTDYENSNENFIKEIALDICVYFIYKKRFSEVELQNNENLAVYKQYKDAIEILEKIKKGEFDNKKIKSDGKKLSSSKKIINYE